MSAADHLFLFSDPLYSAVEAFWKNHQTQRRIGTVLVWAFIGALLAIEANRCNWLPGPVAVLVPTNHFYAVGEAFSVLLGFEILGLVFVLPRSISDSVGKQFEILSIILLRESFQEFVHFGEPIRWELVSASLLSILTDALGGLLTFVALGLFYRFQRHRRITNSQAAQDRFRSTKRLLALVLLIIFVGIGLQDVWAYLTRKTPGQFFETFFTLLVFSDILLIFLSLRYTTSYQVVFRNSGFALATVLIRLAVTAPTYYNVALSLGSVVFAVCLTLAYNAFTPSLKTSQEDVLERDDPTSDWIGA